MDWNKARAFVVTAEEGSFSAAARKLSMTQPTLSRQVMSLEADLAVTLFERSGQTIELTQAGLELLEPARKMYEAAQAFTMVASGQSQSLEGQVVVSVCEMDAVYRLPSILDELRQHEPGIRVEVVVTNGVSDLKRREADIAIRSFRPTEYDFIAKKLGEEHIGLYGTKRYVEALVDNYKQVQILGFNQIDRIITLLSHHGWELDESHFGLVTNYQPMQIALCEKDLGVLFMPEDVANSLPHFHKVPGFEQPLMELPVWLVSPHELRNNRKVKRVFDFIASRLNKRLEPNI